VQSVQPPRHAVRADTATAISIQFASAVNRATVTHGTFRVFGRWSGVAPGTLSFGAGDLSVTFAPARPFFPGEAVTASLSSAVQGTGGQSLRAGYGAEPPHPTPSGSTFFAGVTGAPNQLFAVLLGLPLQPGIALPFGLLNLTGSIGSFAPGTTDGFGEAQQTFTTPLGAPSGTTLALQVAIFRPGSATGLRLTNPEQIAFP